MKLASAAEVEEQAPAAVVCQAAVQNYDWGVRGGGENGLVARMALLHRVGAPHCLRLCPGQVAAICGPRIACSAR